MTSEGEKVASRCDIRNIVYVAECRACWAKARSEESNNYRRQIYVGESSRSLHERASEHIDGASRCEIGNFIAKIMFQDYNRHDGRRDGCRDGRRVGRLDGCRDGCWAKCLNRGNWTLRVRKRYF